MIWWKSCLSLTKTTTCRYLSPMELVYLAMMLIVGHVASVYFIMDGMRRVAEENRKIVLERENTERMLYADGVDVTTDNAMPEQTQLF